VETRLHIRNVAINKPKALPIRRGAQTDPFRDAFNEYTVKVPDGSTDNIFEFQLVWARP